jgi:hypothetical protein
VATGFSRKPGPTYPGRRKPGFHATGFSRKARLTYPGRNKPGFHARPAHLPRAQQARFSRNRVFTQGRHGTEKPGPLREEQPTNHHADITPAQRTTGFSRKAGPPTPGATSQVFTQGRPPAPGAASRFSRNRVFTQGPHGTEEAGPLREKQPTNQHADITPAQRTTGFSRKAGPPTPGAASQVLTQCPHGTEKPGPLREKQPTNHHADITAAQRTTGFSRKARPTYPGRRKPGFHAMPARHRKTRTAS